MLLIAPVTAINRHEREEEMNGYYRRRASLPFEEIRPLDLNEIEFVTDVGESFSDGDTFGECPICGEEATFESNDNAYCTHCSWSTDEELDEEQS